MKITMKMSSLMNSRIIGHKLGVCEYDLCENPTKDYFIVRSEKRCRRCMLGLMCSANSRLGFETLIWYMYTSTAVPVFQGERLSEFWYSKPNCCSQSRWSPSVEPVDEWRHPHVERWRQPTLLQGWEPRPRRSSLLDGGQPGGGRLCQLWLWHREKN
jgi:hypothetical protein